MPEVKETLTRRDYQDALDVQDACNLSGVVFAFARVMQKICNESNAPNRGRDWKNTHPIAVLYASKIASLTGCEMDMRYSNAYNRIQQEIVILTDQEEFN